MYSYGITGSSIDEFQDVDLGALANGHVLTYNSTSGKWEAVAPTGGGAVDLDDLTDVIIAGATEFDTLEYNGTSWVNKHASVVSRVKNAEATTLQTGEVVYIFGASGDMATVKRADNDSDTTSSKTLGIVANPITAGSEGTVVTRGYVDGIDLSVGYTPGDVLWLGESGGFTKTKPVAPEHLVFVGVVCRANANGIVYVAVQNGYELDELHNVSINPSTLADNDLLQYNSSNGQWENVSVATAVPAPSIALDGLSDVNAPSPSDNNLLTWEASSSSWKAKSIFSGITLSRVDAIPRTSLVSTTGLVSGQAELVFFQLGGNFTVNSICAVRSGTTPSGTTVRQLALYEEDASTGVLTKVADTGNVASILAASAYTETAVVTPVALTPGKRYAIAILFVASGTMPNLLVTQSAQGISTGMDELLAASPRLYASSVNTALTSLPASMTPTTDFTTSKAFVPYLGLV